MTEDDRDLVSRVRTSIEAIDVPPRSSDTAKERGRRRRRTARLGVVGVSVVLAVALIAPLVLLSGLRHQPQHPEGPTTSARPVPPANCPDAIPSPQPGYHISCDEAIKQAWDAAAFLQSAAGATAVRRDMGVAEGYAVPSWMITFSDARYVAGVAGCQESGTLGPEASWVVSDASGRLLGFPTRPHGCKVNEHPTSIPFSYTGITYTDPAGWKIEVPYGWLTAPVNITTPDGIEVQGVQIMNPIGLDVPRGSVAKRPGAPAHTILFGTYQIGVVIATDTDPTISHEPLLMPPLNLADFSHQEGVQMNGPGQNAALYVAWVQRADGRDISITGGVGIYAIPDDVMLLRDMLATFRVTGGSAT